MPSAVCGRGLDGATWSALPGSYRGERMGALRRRGPGGGAVPRSRHLHGGPVRRPAVGARAHDARSVQLSWRVLRSGDAPADGATDRGGTATARRSTAASRARTADAGGSSYPSRTIGCSRPSQGPCSRMSGTSSKARHQRKPRRAHPLDPPRARPVGSAAPARGRRRPARAARGRPRPHVGGRAPPRGARPLGRSAVCLGEVRHESAPRTPNAHAAWTAEVRGHDQ